MCPKPLTTYNVLDYPPKGSPGYVPREVLSDQQPEKKAAEFSPDDLVDLPTTVRRLQEENDLSRYIRGRLSDETRNMLKEYKDGRDEKLKEALVRDVNEIILGPSIYDEKMFSKVELREEARDLLNTNPEGVDLVRLNRLLLEDAFLRVLTIEG
jgi:hypothetical protein